MNEQMVTKNNQITSMNNGATLFGMPMRPLVTGFVAGLGTAVTAWGIYKGTTYLIRQHEMKALESEFEHQAMDHPDDDPEE